MRPPSLCQPRLQALRPALGEDPAQLTAAGLGSSPAVGHRYQFLATDVFRGQLTTLAAGFCVLGARKECERGHSRQKTQSLQPNLGVISIVSATDYSLEANQNTQPTVKGECYPGHEYQEVVVVWDQLRSRAQSSETGQLSPKGEMTDKNSRNSKVSFS